MLGLGLSALRWPGLRSTLLDREGTQPDREGFSMILTLNRPKSRGRISLGSPDPFAPPRVDHGFLSAPADLTALVAAVAQARKVAAQPAFAPNLEDEIAPGPHVQRK